MKSSPQPPRGCLSIAFYIMRALLDKLDPQPPAPCKPERPIITFMPGHISVLAEYPATLELDEPEIVRRVRLAFANIQQREDVTWSARRVVILRGDNRTLAAVFGDVPATRKDPARLLRFINRINREIGPREPEPGKRASYDDEGQPPKSADRAEGAAGTGTAAGAAQPASPRALGPDADNFRLTVASPNWLSSGASQHGGTGGPGAWPVAVSVPQSGDGESAAPQPWDVTLPTALNAPPPEAATFAEVAILDTAPRSADLEDAYKRLGANQPPHPLVARLLGESGTFDISANGRLHVVFADTNMLAQVDADLAAHPYLMSDHGLFIAGIVNTIAPQAKLHLIEVLNAYGVGTLESIAWGFQQAVNIKNNMPAGKSLVINCSFMLNIPQDVEQLTAQQLLSPDIQSLTLAEAQQLSQMLQDICLLASPPLSDPATPPTSILIAAAGNDSNTLNHSQARYPAAYPDVTGIAALQRDDTSTPYSNVADTPASVGYATFGGETAPPNNPDPALADPITADPEDGILGVFVGPLDGQLSNPTGWARWAGTSFAAPIVSGTLARLVGAPGIATLRDADSALRTVGTGGGLGEIFHVTQG